MISRSRGSSSTSSHPTRNQYVLRGSLAALMSALVLVASISAHAQSSRETFGQRSQGSDGGGTYDRGSDRWRPEEPTGNAFEDPEPEFLGSAPTRVKPRAAQDDGFEVRDLSEPGVGGESTLSRDAWQGLGRDTLLRMAAKLPYPIASPTLARLFRDLLTSKDAPTEPGLDALRAELLYRSGMVEAVEVVAAGKRSGTDLPIVSVTRSKALLAIGKLDDACETAERVDRESRKLARQSRRDIFSIVSYCAAFDGDTARARRVMSRARTLDLDAPVPSAIVDMLSSGAKPRTPVPKKLKLIDYKFLQLAKAKATARVVSLAEPALLVALARDDKVLADIRSLALDRANRWSALSLKEVDQIVRQITDRVRKGRAVHVAEILSRGGNAGEQDFQKLDHDIADPNHAFALAPIVAREAAERGNRKVGIKTLGAIMKILVAARDLETAQRIVRRVSRNAGRPEADIDNWLTFINIASTEGSFDRSAGLAASASLARRGLMSPTTMHRLVTVLDALGYNVPIPLWQATNRTAQPTSGFLPPTGILANLRNASRKREQGKTILLAMTAIGKNGPAQTNLIALADVIRALRRIGMEAPARRLAIEALWPVWPKKSRRIAGQ